MSEPRTFTYHTRLQVDGATEAALTAYAALYGKAERYLFAAIAAGAEPGTIKPAFMRQHGLTARQFNALSIGMRGKIAAIKERRSGLLEEAEIRIKNAKAVIAQLDKVPLKETAAAKQKRLFKRHQKQRRLATIEARYSSMAQDHAAGTVRIAFGSKKRFRAQFDLAAHHYQSHQQWRDDWQKARSSQFMVVGSKDETAGCQGCVLSVAADGSLSLQLRLPAALAGHGKHITLSGLRFAYGESAIIAALQSSRVVYNKPKAGTSANGQPLKPTRRLEGTALSYRFVRDDIGWRVLISVAVAAPKHTTSTLIGAIGVDLNADHLAFAETDRFGNWIGSGRIDTHLQGKTMAQRSAMLGDAAVEIAGRAQAAGKPVVIEMLDFKVKKAQIETVDARRSRLLSALAYRQAGEMLKAACFRLGVEVIEVNPAYTSVIGAVNHAQHRGISVHQGAAYATARRGLGLSERPTVRVGVIPTRNGGHVTFALPARNRAKHVWSFWSKTRTRLKAAHTAHVRSGDAKKSPAPLSLATQAVSSTRTLPARPRHANRHPHCSDDVLGDIPF